MADKRKIFMLVEGEKTDVVLMRHLLSIYKIDVNYEIVPYATNIYTLYQEMFEENEPEDIDLLQLLKSKEKNPEAKKIFDILYSDILLVFDLDPQDSKFTSDKICRMVEYFCESSDMGKLYVNYPMVEAFYHMKNIPDKEYWYRKCSLKELQKKQYKSRVQRENRNHDYRKFAVNKEECDIIIHQNLYKAWLIVKQVATRDFGPNQIDILRAQLELLQREQQISVLSTCIFFIPEYNPRLIQNGD